MCYDYSLLAGRIKEKYDTRAKFAHAIGLSERTLSLKMNNEIGWTQKDMHKAVELLEIDPKDLSKYFFNIEVQSC